MSKSFVLVHSPLVGPFTWALVAQTLQGRGYSVITPNLTDQKNSPNYYWQQHSEAIVASIETLPADAHLILLGHSGAGPLLPLIAQISSRPVAGYIFVDAGLPHPNKSRLQGMDETEPEFAKEFRQYLADGGRFPDWNDEVLAEIVPDAEIRQKLLQEIQPRGLDFFDEPMPNINAWKTTPSAYIRFTSTYDSYLAFAQKNNWPYRIFEAGHFHILVDPVAVSQYIVDLASIIC